MTQRGPGRGVLAVVLGVAVVGVALDQTSKALVLTYLKPGRVVPLAGDLLTLRLLRNPGAAFSMGTSLTIGLACLAGAVLIAASVFLVPRVRTTSWAIAVGLGLAGVAGNFIDRLVRSPGPFRGEVIDFFSLKYFAVFNVADMCLTTAAVLVIVLSLVVKIDLNGQRPARVAVPAE
ncbi:MAG: signal peptidase II [Propionibacteriaceae bacterium]|jgi:signal peptidase II|nr:signal peptidase II [Propionibacteriaceae bacterium]